jgi:hypothetical protein
MKFMEFFAFHLTNADVTCEGWYALVKVSLLNWFRTCSIAVDGLLRKA